MVHIDLFADVICPWCLIGKCRLERAMTKRPEVDVAIHWRAFQLNPDMPPEGMPRDHYLAAKFGGVARSQQVYDRIAAAAEAEGLDIDFGRIARTPNTVAAHRLIAWSRQQQQDDIVVEALFQAYFQDGRDIGTTTTLTDIATESGLDRDAAEAYLASDDGLESVTAETRFAYENGITGVPCFIINRRYAVTGAQDPEAFVPLFDLGESENSDTSP